MLRRSAVRSDVLGKHFSLTVTDRTIEQIHSSQGFDHYILKTPACDLRSALALRMKREILQELQAGCPSHKEQPKKQQELLKEYKQYVEQYTAEEIEW